MGDESPSEDEFRFHTVGEQLKAERERKSLSLSDMAARTRVPMRHLEAIEKSDFSVLPGTTYTLGFARSYARSLEMDAAKVSADLRQELSQGGYESYQAPTQNYEPTDPARVPSRTLAWTAALVGILVVAGYLYWRSTTLDPAAPLTIPAKTAANAETAAAPPTSPGSAIQGGDVVLTATDTVWVKVYDAENKPLYENEMKAGDTFTVPKEANKPMIVTGRPHVLTVTIGGQAVPPLGLAEKTIADVDISAAALLARPSAVAPASNAAATPPVRTPN